MTMSPAQTGGRAHPTWPGGAVTSGRETLYLDAPTSVPDLLVEHLRGQSRGAIEMAGSNSSASLSYQALYEESTALAGALQSRYSLAPGDRVAVLFANSIEFCVSLFGVLLAGAVAVPLSTKLAGPELVRRLADSDAKVLLGEAQWWTKVSSYREHTALEHVGLVGGGDEDDFALLRHTQLIAPPRDPKAPALLVYTSGTTGRPKGAVLSHENVVQAALTYKRCLELSPADTTVIAVPLFHVTGLNGQLLPMLAAGGLTRIMARFDAEATVQLLNEGSASFFHAAPSVYLLTLEAAATKTARGLRLSLCGGGPITPASIERVLDFAPGVDFRTVYGLTETSSPATLMPAGWLHEKPGSSGIAVPVDAVRVSDASSDVGEILVAGATVARGYFRQPEATASVFEDGWLHTGDLGRLDDDGFLFVIDRLKDMINRGGEKVSSLEVERVLYEFPGVSECAVVARPDPLYGEVPVAFVVGDERLSANELQRFASSRLAKYEVPVDFHFVAELPHNEAGKIVKVELRASP